MIRRAVENAAAVKPSPAPSRQDHHAPSDACSLAATVEARTRAEYVRGLVDAAPRLTDEQHAKLAVLLRGPDTERNRAATSTQSGAA